MPDSITLDALKADPGLIAATLTMPDGTPVLFRPLGPGDAGMLGEYFLSLSDETKRRYGPHPFDQATADQLCANIDLGHTLRMIGVLDEGGRPRIVAYIILLLGITEGDRAHYARNGIALDPDADCTLAPSLADAYQNRGWGTVMMRHLIDVARRLGRKRMVLMWGTQATNSRAIRFYEKLGFRYIATFEEPPGVFNREMILDL